MSQNPKPEVLLENWCRHGDRLYGQFYRHAVIADGRFAHTSTVLDFDPSTGIAETERSVYTLGQPQLNECAQGCKVRV